MKIVVRFFLSGKVDLFILIIAVDFVASFLSVCQIVCDIGPVLKMIYGNRMDSNIFATPQKLVSHCLFSRKIG